MKYILFLAAVTLSAQSVLSISVPANNVRGREVEITVTKTGTDPIAALQLTLSFSGGISSVSVTTGGAASIADKVALGGNFVGSNFKFIVYGVNTTAIPNGPVAVIRAVATGPGQVTITGSAPIAADGSGNALPVTVGPPVSVSVFDRCDVNGDGQTNSTDVDIAAREALGINAARETTDLNDDANVNVLDVQWVANGVVTGVCR